MQDRFELARHGVDGPQRRRRRLPGERAGVGVQALLNQDIERRARLEHGAAPEQRRRAGGSRGVQIAGQRLADGDFGHADADPFHRCRHSCVSRSSAMCSVLSCLAKQKRTMPVSRPSW
jgi:hypothetical protein